MSANAGAELLFFAIGYLAYTWCASCFLAKILEEGIQKLSSKIIFSILWVSMNGAMALFVENGKVPYILYAAANHILLILLTMAVFCGNPMQKETEKMLFAAIFLALAMGLVGNFSESCLSCGWLLAHALATSSKHIAGRFGWLFSEKVNRTPQTETIGRWAGQIIVLIKYGVKIAVLNWLAKPMVSVCSDKRKRWYLYLSIPLIGMLFVLDFVNWAASNGIMVQNWGKYGLYENQLFSHGAMCIFTGLAMAASGFFVFGMNKIYQEERAGEQYRTQVMYYQTLEEQYTRQERLRHDLKNHLISLENLIQNRQWEQAGSYLREMAKIGQIEAGEEATGSLVMDALLYHKKHEALEHGIYWKCDIEFPRNSPIKEIDLCILVGNILDNALESCIRLREKESLKEAVLQEEAEEKLWIQICMRTFKQCLLFEVRNPTDLKSPSETVKSRKNHPEHHGWGLANIKAAADAYHGTMHMEIKEGIFTLSVLLPLV